MSKPRNIWWQRLEVIESLSLATIAEEVNAQRLRDLRVSLPQLGGREREKRRRLIELFEAGELTELPRDLRADPKRMLRALVALHHLIGKFSKCISTVEAIAEKTRDSIVTARRAVLDLDAANLVYVRRRDRARRHGGQGPSEYMIVWSTLRDLAAEQGLQHTLFDGPEVSIGQRQAGDEASVIAESDRPGMPPGQSSVDRGAARHRESPASHGDSAPSHSESAASHHETARYHSERAPSHCDSAYRRGRAGSSPGSCPLPPPPSFPEGVGDFENWGQVRNALAAAGVRTVRGTLRAFADGAWQPRQVLALLATIERQTVDGVPPWGPGAICFHAANAEPGAAIEIPPSEAWQRAKRNREVATASASQQRQFAAQASAAERSRSDAAALEPLHGPEVDRLDVDAAAGLLAIDRGSQRWHLLAKYSTGSPRWGMFRPLLLRAISEQAAAVEGGGHAPGSE